jgi:hypothetical protein
MNKTKDGRQFIIYLSVNIGPPRHRFKSLSFYSFFIFFHINSVQSKTKKKPKKDKNKRNDSQFLDSGIETERVELQEENSKEVLVEHDEVSWNHLWISVACSSYLALAHPPALQNKV